MITKRPRKPKLRKWDVWLEGYAATGEAAPASFHGSFVAATFQDAVEMMLAASKWDMRNYDPMRNSYWACKFYPTEERARASFG